MKMCNASESGNLLVPVTFHKANLSYSEQGFINKIDLLSFHSCTVHLDIIKVLLFHQQMHYIFVQ